MPPLRSSESYHSQPLEADIDRALAEHDRLQAVASFAIGGIISKSRGSLAGGKLDMIKYIFNRKEIVKSPVVTYELDELSNGTVPGKKMAAWLETARYKLGPATLYTQVVIEHEALYGNLGVTVLPVTEPEPRLVSDGYFAEPPTTIPDETMFGLPFTVQKQILEDAVDTIDLIRQAAYPGIEETGGWKPLRDQGQ